MAAKTESQHKSRLDWRKEKELEEARKAGTAPALTDEEGKDINPHIPQYISQAPWYYGTNRPTLKHQRPQDDKQKQYSSLNEWFIKGTKTVPAATKFRKGACENCGAMTHKKKDCLERPRRVGARFTGDDIKPDEHVQPQLSFDYDGKRDRWNGYSVDDYRRTVEEYTKLEMAKQHLKAEQLEAELAEGKKSEVADEPDSEDEDKYADRIDMPGQKFDTKRRTTVRNLRIREDTAKYLHNLDPNSAYYDPKTRSMRQNPFKETDGSGNNVTYAGDNFVRFSGDTQKMAQSQMFAWEAYEKGADVHLQADPTKLELLHKEYKVKKGDFEKDKKLSVLEKYGGEEHLNAPPKELLLAQTENYVEFSRTGKVIRGQEKAVAKSKYEEDVYTNNHTSVWGSYWQEGRWGYACCHSFIRNSYCTGDAGKETSASRQRPQITEPLTNAAKMIQEAEQNGKTLMEIHQENRKKGKKREKSVDEDDEESKREKLNKALRKEERHQQEAERLLAIDERKRPYNSLKGDNLDVTEEELEAYRLRRQQQDDPMKDFL
ncbi:pre-mRNA-splicing factor SLU7-like isoform X1 [Acropora muricata]|uniref:pre-mRNA-splicing factor SLU7-like isoform X1 n=1 Tax=Acropora millepora TaxID=45264 RepID=UPI0010FCA93F|nr:pre-mRNA-splicing factor SLU7-like isoform X1 [Acropora millepora]